jgi:hypothetical protein
MKELFADRDTSDITKIHMESLNKEIGKFTDDQIINADFDEWVNYFFDRHKIEPIVLYLEEIRPDISETTIERRNPFYDGRIFEQKMHYSDGYKISYVIPFSGDYRLLYSKPSSFYANKFSVDEIKESDECSYGEITFSIDYQKAELSGSVNNEYVKSQFNYHFKTYIDTIKSINRMVEAHNSYLIIAITDALEKRKKRADEFFSIREKLAIPLKADPNAPSTVRAPLKKVQVKKPEISGSKQKEIEREIAPEDYENIKRIINIAGSTMEKAARTFIKLNEEELRDIIISHLNSHYLGTATGETFSKTGKTDIYIPFENKAAYIAECKIWGGVKSLKEALDQLFGYTTWRDVKNSVIIFNKENKDFNGVLSAINAFLDNNELCLKKTSIACNEWQCEFKKNRETTCSIMVQIVVFDLYI